MMERDFNLGGVEHNTQSEAGPENISLHQRVPELGILRSVCMALDSHREITGSHPELSETAERLNDYTARITQKYIEVKNKLIRHLLQVAGALKSYGVMAENSEIVSMASVKEQFLKEMTDEELFRFGVIIKDHSIVYSDTLYFLGVEPFALEDFHRTIDHFSYATGLSGSGAYENTEWKKEIDRNFDEAFSLIHNTLDQLAEHIRERYPGFYSDYLRSKAFPAAGEAG